MLVFRTTEVDITDVIEKSAALTQQHLVHRLDSETRICF